MDYEKLASELLQALRGRRSQRLLSRRLGYESNVIYRWERGTSWPAAEDFFRLAESVGVPLETAMARYRPDWKPLSLVTNREGVSELLERLRDQTSITKLAVTLGKSRYVVSRWLSGETAIRLPDFLELVQACGLRLLDFVATLVCPTKLPSIRESHARLEANRKAAYENPWSQAVLRVLELSSYQKLKRHRPGLISGRLGIEREEELACLQLLLQAGQIRWEGQRYVVNEITTQDTRRDREKSRQVKGFWIDVNRDRLSRGVPGVYGYNVCSISKKDHERLVELYLKFFHEMQHLVASSDDPDEVVLVTTQIVALDRHA